MDSIFETMERTGIVDRILFWMAVFMPLFVAGLAFVLRDDKVVTRNRHRWVLMALAAPALLILWRVYNRIVDHFGLDSVKGLIINVAVFIVAALLFTGLRIMLKALITEPPPPAPAPMATPVPTTRFTTTRMRSLNPDNLPPPESTVSATDVSTPPGTGASE